MGSSWFSNIILVHHTPVFQMVKTMPERDKPASCGCSSGSRRRSWKRLLPLALVVSSVKAIAAAAAAGDNMHAALLFLSFSLSASHPLCNSMTGFVVCSAVCLTYLTKEREGCCATPFSLASFPLRVRLFCCCCSRRRAKDR